MHAPNGIDAELLTRNGSRRDGCLLLDCSPAARYPIMADCCSGAAASHATDAVAWGYARGAGCARASTSFSNAKLRDFSRRQSNKPVETSRGTIRAKRSGSRLPVIQVTYAAMAGFRLPYRNSRAAGTRVGAFEPVLDTVVNVRRRAFLYQPVDKGELVMGGDIDGYIRTASAAPARDRAFGSIDDRAVSFVSRVRMMPDVGPACMDMSMDGIPIIRQIAGGQSLSGLRLVLWRLQSTPASGCASRTRSPNDAPSRTQCRLHA